MLQVLLFSLVTTSSAFTTHRYDSYDSFGNYRPNTGVFDKIFRYDNSNERRPVQMYEYAKRYNGVVISDVYDGPSDSVNKRIDTPYGYENPNQWNRHVPWNRIAVTEPVKILNRFEGSNKDRQYLYDSNTSNRPPVVQYPTVEVINQRKRTNELNKTQGSLPQISKRSDDVNRTLVITEQQITWHNDHLGLDEDNANITTRSITTDNKTNSLNVSDKLNVDKINRTTKTNGGTVSSLNKAEPSKTANDSNDYITKITQDNEVTPSTQELQTKVYEDDRWIWSNAEDQVVETTTLLNVDDRAAFSGDGCPDGKVKFGNTCVEKD